MKQSLALSFYLAYNLIFFLYFAYSQDSCLSLIYFGLCIASMSPESITTRQLQRGPKRLRGNRRSPSLSHSDASSSTSEVEGEPNDPHVKDQIEKKRKARNQRRYYRRYVMFTIQVHDRVISPSLPSLPFVSLRYVSCPSHYRRTDICCSHKEEERKRCREKAARERNVAR